MLEKELGRGIKYFLAGYSLIGGVVEVRLARKRLIRQQGRGEPWMMMTAFTNSGRSRSSPAHKELH